MPLARCGGNHCLPVILSVLVSEMVLTHLFRGFTAMTLGWKSVCQLKGPCEAGTISNAPATEGSRSPAGPG